MVKVQIGYTLNDHMEITTDLKGGGIHERSKGLSKSEY